MAAEIVELDDSEWLRRGYHDVFNRCRALVDPASAPTSYAEFLAALKAGDPGHERVRVVAVEDGRVVGMGWTRVPLTANLSVAYLYAAVDPDHRRRGIGRALASRLEARVPAGRTELYAWARMPADGSDAVLHAVAALGYQVAERARQSALRLPAAVPDDLGAVGNGYRLETFRGTAPTLWQVGLGVLRGLVDAEAPSGDLAWEPAPQTPEEYLADVAAIEARGAELLTTIAVTADGEVVAYTEMELPAAEDHDVWQEGTLVRRDHRGHGLGLAVKAANLRALVALDCRYPRLCTGNNAENRWMLAVNSALGFVPVGETVGLIKRR